MAEVQLTNLQAERWSRYNSQTYKQRDGRGTTHKPKQRDGRGTTHKPTNRGMAEVQLTNL